jgi:hypothetical protein
MTVKIKNGSCTNQPHCTLKDNGPEREGERRKLLLIAESMDK